MRHMGNSGKTAIGAFAAAAGLLVLTSITLEEAALVAFLGAVAVGYVASVAEAFARHRYLALLAGGVGTSLFIGCSIAFMRTWGLAFNQDAAALGRAVTTRDSDIYFYLAAASGCLTLLVLFCAAVWPPRRRPQRKEPTRPTGPARPRGAGPARGVGSARAAGAPARPAARLPAGARQPAQRPVQQKSVQPVQQAAPRKPAQRTPGQRTPAQRSGGRTPGR
ncbi:hypothetical protein LFT45_03755 [Arthrobacter sp. FW305-BF8]|uniref:hypothetical protein n=2 Tax=Arthrobacter TaxID=1663 RepID=UPI001F3950EB|nr:hypothetical protein [Arthrobacter sp. FW305-BF8]UKA55071.1 hypothetical protein LFT45_03755 [Arthrobacter sp. FW305-BF8]